MPRQVVIPTLRRLGLHGIFFVQPGGVHAGGPQPYALPRVYPYSSDALYPAISGADGQSFPELIEASVSESARGRDQLSPRVPRRSL